MLKRSFNFIRVQSISFILGLSLGLLCVACATYYDMPNFLEKVYRPCEDSETNAPIGKFCFKRCVDTSLFKKGCTEWEVDVKDFSDRKTFNNFRTAGFKLMVAP